MKKGCLFTSILFRFYLFLFLIILQSGLQELDILRYILVVGVGLVERLAFVVNQHVEGLRIGAELDALPQARSYTPLLSGD